MTLSESQSRGVIVQFFFVFQLFFGLFHYTYLICSISHAFKLPRPEKTTMDQALTLQDFHVQELFAATVIRSRDSKDHESRFAAKTTPSSSSNDSNVDAQHHWLTI